MNRILKRIERPIDSRGRIVLPQECASGKKTAEITVYENKIVVVLK